MKRWKVLEVKETLIVGSPEYEVRERRTELEREKTEETGRDRKMDLDTVEKLPFSKVEAYRICSRTGEERCIQGRQRQRMSFYLHMDIKIFTSQPMAILIWKIRRFPCIRLGLHLAESKTGIEQA